MLHQNTPRNNTTNPVAVVVYTAPATGVEDARSGSARLKSSQTTAAHRFDQPRPSVDYRIEQPPKRSFSPTRDRTVALERTGMRCAGHDQRHSRDCDMRHGTGSVAPTAANAGRARDHRHRSATQRSRGSSPTIEAHRSAERPKTDHHRSTPESVLNWS